MARVARICDGHARLFCVRNFLNRDWPERQVDKSGGEKRMIRSGTSKRAITQWTKQSAPGQGPQYIEVPKNWKVLVVEDALARQLQFRDWLGSNTRIVARVSDAVDALRSETYDLVMLDRDLGFGEFGETVAAEMVNMGFKGEVIIHSANPTGAEMILRVLSDAKIKAKIVPFTLLGLIRS